MKRRTLKSRLLAFLLVLCMVVGLTPVYAVSEGEIVAEYFIYPDMADDDGMVHVEFTPEEDGHYFLAISPQFDSFMSCSHGAEPVDSFPFDDDYGYGSVYELKAGQTYCFAQHHLEDFAYTAYMKKVSVPETFDIPETLTGYVGTETWLNIAFEGALSTEVTSSDLTVVNTETGGNAHGHVLELLKVGTATVTVTAQNGVVKTCEVTVKEPGQIALDETKVVDLEAGESVAYTFVPAESGNYIVHHTNEVGWLDIWLDGNHNGDCELITETRRGRVFYDLVAGESYILEVTCPEWAEKMDSAEIVLTKSAKTEGFTIRGNTKGIVDSNLDYQLQFTPEFGVSDDITWSVSDESIAEIVLDTNIWCSLYLKKTGTVTLTATSQQDETKTASVEITVEEPKYIQVGETVEVNLQPGESVEYNFYADGKAGYYMFMIPRDAMCGVGRYGDIYDEFWIWNEEYECLIVELPEDGHMTIELHAPEDRPEPVSTTLTLVEAVEATDISFAGGDTVEIGVGEEVRIPFDLVDGNYIRDLNFEFVSDNCCVEVYDFDSSFIGLYGYEAGTTTIAFMSNGIYKELTVNVLPYGHDIADENKWVGTAEDYEVITVEYTPEKDGFYFFHHQDLPGLVPAKDSEQPLADFWHNEYGVWGNVYQLEGGKTYTFVSEHEWIGDYAYFVKEIFMAEDFEIPSAINGMVNGRDWLGIEADGVVNPTYKSTNEDVVLVGSGGSDGVELHLVGEGTAEIIVTNANGKEKVCTVTVSGKVPVQEFYDYVEFGLAAGGSVTYSYTPWESGLYWFRIDENAGVDVSVALNGEPVAYKYDMGTEGVVYELTAETEYMVTVTGAEPVVSYLFASLVQEATHLELEAERIQVYEGVESTLWCGLRDDEGNYAAADVTVKSSDESVIQITSYNNQTIWFNPVAAGTATITVTTHNGLTDSVEVTVIEKPTLELNEVVKETLKPQEGCQWFFVAEKSGDYEITVTTNGYSVFATTSWDDEVGSTYLEKEFEGPATFTHKHHMEAGELWTYVVYNRDEEATVEATMNLKLMEVVTVVSPEDIEEAAKADEVVIDVSDTGAAKVELPVDALETLVEAEKPLTLVTGDTTVTLDAAALAAVAESAKGEDITILVEEIKDAELNEKQQAAVADREVAITISAEVFAGDQYVGDFKGGKATIKVPMKLEEGEKAEDYTVFYLDDEGNLTAVETFVKDGEIFFVTDHFSEYVVLKTVTTNPDVPNTGDNAHLGMMMGLLMFSVIGLALVLVYGKQYAYVGKWER